MRTKKILVLFKRTNYQSHLLEFKRHPHSARNPLIAGELRRIRLAQATHLKSLEHIKAVLKEERVTFVAISRGQESNYRGFDLIISVGGDGTFLEASRYSYPGQILLGVNSVPNESVGRFCAATADNFRKIFKKVLNRQFKLIDLHRLKIEVNGKASPILALNDILITHQNPSVLSRYFLKVKGTCEEQRSSGLWVSTAAGSSGAMKSAGGKLLNPQLREFQYFPRELYNGKIKSYKLTGGILNLSDPLSAISLMREGMIYIDGSHVHIPFPYATTVKIGMSAYPIRTIKL